MAKERVKPGVQPKRGPRGTQSAAMDWLSARMEKKKKKDEPQNASTDYSKLRLLGKFLAEKETQLTLPFEGGPKPGKPNKPKQKRRTPTKKPKKHVDAPGQGQLPFKSRRRGSAVPRRRKGEVGRRAVDRPTSRRRKGFEPAAEGQRSEDQPTVAATAVKRSERRGRRYSRALTGYYSFRVARAATKSAIRKLSRRRPRRAAGPNPLTGGTEGSRGVQT